MWKWRVKISRTAPELFLWSQKITVIWCGHRFLEHARVPPVEWWHTIIGIGGQPIVDGSCSTEHLTPVQHQQGSCTAQPQHQTSHEWQWQWGNASHCQWQTQSSTSSLHGDREQSTCVSVQMLHGCLTPCRRPLFDGLACCLVLDACVAWWELHGPAGRGPWGAQACCPWPRLVGQHAHDHPWHGIWQHQYGLSSPVLWCTQGTPGSTPVPGHSTCPWAWLCAAPHQQQWCGWSLYPWCDT